MTVAGDRAALLAALRARRDLADWTVRVVTSQVAWRALGVDVSVGTQVRATIAAELHRDGASGRGSARLTLTSAGDARAALTQAIDRADAAIGPAWASPAPAAPARVDVADPAIDPERADVALTELAAALTAAAAPATVTSAELALAIDDVELLTRRGQRARWRETAVTVTATVAAGDRARTFTSRARRLAELDLTAAAALVAGDPAAPPVPSGRYPVALAAAALIHGELGLLAAFAAQADPRLERQGLVRYHQGQPIAEGATLTLASDGTLPFGWASAPLGEHGDAVRRFPLITRGVAVGLGLDDREAALRGLLPNGGVRGLVVPPGSDDADALLGPGTLLIERLTWLELDRTTGWFRAGFDGARLYDTDGAVGEPARAVGGGTLRGDAIALVGRARTSREVVATPSFRGPALWHLGVVAVD
ncbi:MAG: hypothetical protein IPL61_31830 [Myxococcales bacterium]|nr:hypothetical protein [Myxococcales bacterium]